MKPAAILFVLFLLLPPTPIGGEVQAESSDARVSGVISVRISLSEDAVVAGVTLIFESAGKEYRTVTSDSGTYTTVVPSGVYTVRTSWTGFCSARRASFQAKASSSTVVNLYLYPCALVNEIQVDDAGRYAGERCRYEDPVSTDSFEIRSTSGETRDVVIRYGVRKSRNDRVVYEQAIDRGNEIHQVVVSYDTFTVYADVAEYDPARHRVEVHGAVLMDANGVRTTAAQAQIEISGGVVVVRRQQ